MLEAVGPAKLPTPYGEFKIFVFKDPNQPHKEHVALVMGDLEHQEAVLLRVHSECLTGDALFSMRCDCGPQLQEAMKRIAEEGSGAIVYLRQEGRGIGLFNKIKAYELQDQGLDTVQANEELGFAPDLRNYEACSEIFKALKIKTVRLMTNNPNKLQAMRDEGLDVVERVSLKTQCHAHNEKYLSIKRHKLGHFL